MRSIISLAKITVKGIRSEKLYYILFLATLLVLFLTPYFATLSPRQGKQVALDFILATQSFMGLVIAIFIGSGMLSKDMDSKVIYSVISRPISRSEYIIGRFAGLAFIILTVLLITSLLGMMSYYGTLWLFPTLGDMPNWRLYWLNMFFLHLKLLILVAIAFLFSSFSTSTFFPLAVTIGVYIVGSSSLKVKTYLESTEYWGAVFKILVNIAFYVFPNLSAFDLKNQAAYNLPVQSSFFPLIILYGVLYTVIVLSLTVFIFKRRDLV